jgi:hypothetical protein
MVWVKVDRDHEHDTAVGSGYSYGDESPAVCRECGHRGRLIEFNPEGRDADCECATSVVPGTIYVPVAGNVERCDLCQQFPGDLEAALAVSEKVGQPAWALMDPWVGDWQEGVGFTADDRPVWPTLADEVAYLKSPWDRTDTEQAVAEEFYAWADRNGIG